MGQECLRRTHSVCTLMIEQGYSGCESQRFNGWRVSASSLSHVRVGAAGARVRGTELKSGHEQINSVRSQVQRNESEKAYFPTTGKAGDGHPNITRNPICDRVRERLVLAKSEEIMWLKQIARMRIHEGASRRSARYHTTSDSPFNAILSSPDP